MKGTITIFEILITLLLTTTIAGSSALHFSKIKEEIELKNFSNQLRDLIYKGYLSAIREEKNYQIKNEAPIKKMILARSDGVQRYSLKIPEKINLHSKDSISFYPAGTTSPTTIIVTKDTKTCLLKLALRGRVMVECG